MDAELKAKWVKALRSGEYEQGRRALCTGRGTFKSFCCLGVLCEIQGFDVMENIPLLAERQTEMLPPGLDGGLLPEHRAKVAQMNDGGVTFDRIADYIEREVPASPIAPHDGAR